MPLRPLLSPLPLVLVAACGSGPVEPTEPPACVSTGAIFELDLQPSEVDADSTLQLRNHFTGTTADVPVFSRLRDDTELVFALPNSPCFTLTVRLAGRPRVGTTYAIAGRDGAAALDYQERGTCGTAQGTALWQGRSGQITVTRLDAPLVAAQLHARLAPAPATAGEARGGFTLDGILKSNCLVEQP